MKIVVSIADPASIEGAQQSYPDLLEIRIDLMRGDLRALVASIREQTPLPLIGTIRSRAEGGSFEGTPSEWLRIMTPLLPYLDIVDMECTVQAYAAGIKKRGKVVIASYHTGGDMPDREGLERILGILRSYGDLPKIVVRPETADDLIAFLSFTLHSGPLITSITGEEFSYARVLLPLFGSEMVFCHAGSPVAEGQYHIRDLKKIYGLLFHSSPGQERTDSFMD
jgi:3-dehydroquinate dehydratase-1